MAERNETLWTIEELGGAVASALSIVDYEGAPSGRVRDVPDQRTIRYYTTLGLIDRPAAMRGRTALYGKRHLLQLVAIKRLQARGLTLAEVQAELAGVTPKALKSIAAIKDEDATPDAMSSVTEETGRRAEAFWGSLPSEPKETNDTVVSEKDTPARLLSGLRIGDDVLLLFSPRRAVDAEDQRALEEAARPLLRLLQSRGLT